MFINDFPSCADRRMKMFADDAKRYLTNLLHEYYPSSEKNTVALFVGLKPGSLISTLISVKSCTMV